MKTHQHDLTRTVLAVLTIGILIAASFWILRPFLAAAIWATMIVVATWPLLLAAQRRLWDRRLLAVAVMTLGLLLVLVIPFALAIGTIVGHADEIVAWTKSLKDAQVPSPPDWVGRLPFVGARAVEVWQEVAAAGGPGLVARIAPYAGKVAAWFAEQAGNVGGFAVESLLTVMLCAIMYSTGETAAGGVRRFARRLAGDRGVHVAHIAAQAIRGVALGIVVSALVQSVLGGIGLAAAGVPFAAVLTAVMFILAIAQIGVVPVLLGALAWLYWKDQTGWLIALAIWTAFVGMLDNFLRPMLIKKGADLPLLLIFVGVIGGLIAFGVVGIFVGPVMLAVTYKLLEAWLDEPPPDADDGTN
ncbi:MAG TPA: AI-2E family transporter YdiK [Casimicrobiaceae bacterium]|nr:AI-2E family transporter YdiK [Casimicrobiaceae bacterium]